MPLRGRGGRASWPPQAAYCLEKTKQQIERFASLAVERADFGVGGCGGPDTPEDSAGGAVAD